MGGGKSSKTVVGYKYYAGFQMILARCIHKILAISIDNNQAWTGFQVGSGVININAPNLFGGSSGSDPEGGVVGSVSFNQGLDSQLPDAYLQSRLGVKIPAYRQVSAFVAQQPYMGNSPYMKQWSTQAERIHIIDDGSVQWYDAKSQITGVAAKGGIYTFAATTAHTTQGYNSSEGSVTLADGETITVQMYGGAASAFSRWATDADAYAAGPGRKPWAYYINISKDGAAPTMYYPGEYDTPDEAAAAAAAAGPITLTGPGTFYIYLADGDTEAYNNRGSATFGIGLVNVNDMNPAHMIREALTNAEWGYGYDVSDIDDTNFQAVADTLYSESFGLSYFWDDGQVSLDDVMEKFEDTVDCAIYVDRSTLKWTIKLVRDDYDASTLPSFTVGQEIISVEDFNRPAFMDLINTEQITYSSNIGNQTPTITIPNPALLLQQGVPILQQTTYDLVCNMFLAARIAERDLAADGSPLASGVVYMTYTPETKLLHRGAVCKLTLPLHNMNETVVRVTSISFGDGTTKRIKMGFLEDKFSLGVTAITGLPPVAPGSGAVLPLPVLYQQAIEIPYYFLVQQQGQTTVDQQLATDSTVGLFGIAAARPAGGLSADLYVDTGSGFSKAGKGDFCPYGTLVADLPLPGLAGSDTFTLANYEDLDELEANHVLLIGNEFVCGTYAGSGVFTSVARACLDSVPELHVAGDAVLGVMNYLDSDDVDYTVGESVGVRLLTNTTGGTLALGSATTASVVFAGRASKPYPPANVKIAGGYYPATVAGTFAVTWADRNRIQQTGSGVPLGFVDASIAPFANTRYSLLFKDHTGAILVQQDSIGPATASVALGVTDTITMELWTVDDIGASLFKFSTTFAYTPDVGVTINTITATAYTPVDNSTIIDGGSA